MSGELLALLPGGVSGEVALFLIAASFFASALTAAFGVGGGMAMLVLLGLFLPVAALIPVHGAVQLGSNTGRAWRLRAHVRRDIVLPFALGSVAGAVVGGILVIQLPDAVLKPLLGLFVLAVTWVPLPAMNRVGRAGLMIGSSLLALLSMMLGATGALLNVLFAQIIPEDRRALVATHAAAMIAQHGLKILVFAIAGFAFADWLPLIGAMIAAGYLGTINGGRLLEAMPERRFRLWFRIGLSILALDLVRQGVSGS